MVGVPEHDDPTRGGATLVAGGEDVSVGRYCEVAHRAQALSHRQGTESLGQGPAAVVGGAGRRREDR